MNGPPSTSKDLTDITNIIPPKLIKNYDVFIVLKPKDNDKTEENNLIDFDTDTSFSKIYEVTPKTEENSKKELNVIDVYENIDVSPFTLSFHNKSVDDVIFDPLELKNTNETTDKHDSNDKYAVLRDLENAYVDIGLNAATNSKVKDDVEWKDLHNFECKEDFTFPKLELTSADEDLIDEMLSTNIQRLSMNNQKYGSHNNHNNTDIYDANADDKILSQTLSDNDKMSFDIPKLIRTERQISQTPEIKKIKTHNLGAIPKNNMVELRPQVPLNDSINKVLDFNATLKIKNVESKFTPKISVSPDISTQKYVLPKQIFEKPQSMEEVRLYVDNFLKKSRTKYCNVLKYYNTKYFYKTLLTNEVEFVVETVQLDAKKYRQKRIAVEDSVAATFTLGPSLDEKKLVLPQIMDRLLNKKKRMEKFADCKPKLILDCGSLRKKDIPVKPNPVVLTEDRNTERLRSLLTRQNFDNFVRGGI